MPRRIPAPMPAASTHSPVPEVVTPLIQKAATAALSGYT
jgi:hypothetical protein